MSAFVGGGNTSVTQDGTTFNVVSADDFHDELFSIYGWSFGLVILYSVLGTIGNSIVLYIYYKTRYRNKTRIFIMCLAILDLCNCVFNMPMEAAILWRVLMFDMDALCSFTRGTTFFINNANAMVFIAIAVDRYLLVYKPLKSLVLTVRYAKIACFLSLAGGIVTSFPGFILYGTANMYEILDGQVIVGQSCYIKNNYSLDTGWPMVFSSFLFGLYILVFIFLTGTYIAIGRKIHKVTLGCMDLSDLGTRPNKCQNKKDNQKRRNNYSKGVIKGGSAGKHSRSIALHGDLKDSQENVKSRQETVVSYSCNSEPQIAIRRVDQQKSTCGEKDANIEMFPNDHATADDVAEAETLISPTPKTRRGISIREDEADTNSKLSSSSFSNEIDMKGEQQQTDRFRRRSLLSSRRVSSINTGASRAVTIMMIAITFGFILSFTPYLIIVTIRYIAPSLYMSFSVPGKTIYHVFLRSYFLNSVINPLIYGFVNKEFRSAGKYTPRTLIDGQCEQRHHGARHQWT